MEPSLVKYLRELEARVERLEGPPKLKTIRDRFYGWANEKDLHITEIPTARAAFQEGERQALANKPKLPEPVREPLDRGQEYFYPSPSEAGIVGSYLWVEDKIDNRLLNRGLIYLTREDATTAAKAMLGEVG